MSEHRQVFLIYDARTGAILSVRFTGPPPEALPPGQRGTVFQAPERFLRRPSAYRVDAKTGRIVPARAGALSSLLPGGRLGAAVTLALLLFAAGCASEPPAEIREGIALLREGVSDYVDHEQPRIEERIAALQAVREAAATDEESAAIEARIAEEESYLALGHEIPPALAELDAWARGLPLDEEGGDE